MPPPLFCVPITADTVAVYTSDGTPYRIFNTHSGDMAFYVDLTPTQRTVYSLFCPEPIPVAAVPVPPATQNILRIHPGTRDDIRVWRDHWRPPSSLSFVSVPPTCR
jgi:hypothetical protein